MATTNPILENSFASARSAPGLLVLLAAMEPETLQTVLSTLASLPSAEGMIVATPDAPATESWHSLKIIPVPSAVSSWTLTAAEFVLANQLAEQNEARAILILGPASASLRPSGLRELSNAVLNTPTDLAIPCYEMPPHAGLVNSAILYPLTRALFASRARFPLAIDLGLSRRMAERLASVAERLSALNQNTSLVWPVSEAAVAGFAVNEFDVGPRAQPQPADPDINAILASVTGSLFAEIDAKAAFWQRARQTPVARHPMQPPQISDASADITPMLDTFRLAYTNLREIWSLVLPPNTLIGLKRLYATDATAFQMPEHLWARIVYDFVLAYRLRTINRGHLLGALIPLYLAWVASHIKITSSGTGVEQHIEAVAGAFEAEKPYLVSRWRWPDRFNP
jgi:hypothetical protein